MDFTLYKINYYYYYYIVHCSNLSKVIHSKPSGFNDTIASTKTSTFMRHKQLCVSHLSNTNTGVLYPPEFGPRTPPGQPDHRSTKDPVTRHVARPHPPAQHPNSDQRSQCVQITLLAAATPQFGNIA